MPKFIAPLIAADEYLIHQIPNTLATVATADHSWTEKIWATLIRKDAGLQVDFGLGKYTNRSIMDGFAGVSRGVEQHTVRASRILEADPGAMAVGPLRYEILEPFRRIRMALERNSAQPVQFDLVFEARMPAFFEGRDAQHEPGRGRISSDLVRYHQPGTASGWVSVGTERFEIKPDEWFAFRDHSWGTREHVGLDPTDLVPHHHNMFGEGLNGSWFVSQIQRPDGSFYELMYYYRKTGRGLEHFNGFINESDGTQIPLLKVWTELQLRASDRAVMRGKIYATLDLDGRGVRERVFEIEAIEPEAGFRLHPALYAPWKGTVHGSYKGELHVEGEHIPDVRTAFDVQTSPAWQIRDRPVHIREGDNVGFGDIEGAVIGNWPGIELV
jgi:hypothetical protein